MSRKIFVSYAPRDRSWVPQVLDQLKEQKLLSADDNVFLDHQDFSAGDSFRDAARAAIAAADTVVVLWSPAAAESKWVNYELAMADALGKHLLVVSPRGSRTDLPIDMRSVEMLELAAG